MDEWIGTDIMLDENGNFVPAPDGDLQTVSGLNCLIQDVKNELITYPGDLFYDDTYGVGLLDFVQREGLELDRLELTQRIIDRLSRNDLIDSGSVECEILGWDMHSIDLAVSFKSAGSEVKLGVTAGDSVNVKVVNG